jgi:hypothetical protein
MLRCRLLPFDRRWEKRGNPHAVEYRGQCWKPGETRNWTWTYIEYSV